MELCKELDLNSPATIHFHLKKLAEKGYIKKASSKNRTIELLVNNEYADKRDNVIDVALLGNIAAGNPIEAIEQPDEFFARTLNMNPGTVTLDSIGSYVDYTLTLPTDLNSLRS